MFKPLRTFIGIQIILLGSFFLLACSDSVPGVERVQLNTTAAEHAAFSTTGMLALSSGAQVGIYQPNGSLAQAVNVGNPNGIWRVHWQNNDILWIYDRDQLMRFQWRSNTLDTLVHASPHSIRYVASNDSELVIATEQQQLIRITFTPTPQFTIMAALPHPIQSIGFIPASVHTDEQLFAADTRGNLYLGNINNMQNREVWRIHGAIKQVLTDTNQNLWIISNESNSPVASTNPLSVTQITESDHLQKRLLSPNFTAHSFAFDGSLGVVGGSNNRWFAFHTEHSNTQTGQLGEAQNPLRQGTIAAVFIDPTKVFMITSRGELQIWQKTRIFQ
ncbi:hypothetical protein [Aliidiomarina celeris]|uniref:hypothetical protein n=1 Tax=Aliidiomarina celeris TaxID=2249428 RepID=UPI0013003836|nr:hypothetical protein [Aliidiomarina celeris]